MGNKHELKDDLTTITKLLQNSLAIELWRGGLSQAEIGKRLGIATGSVNQMLKGVNKEVITTSQGGMEQT
jgi:predicted transcriptional regulator